MLKTKMGRGAVAHSGNSLLGNSTGPGGGGTPGSGASSGGSNGNSKNSGNGKNSIASIYVMNKKYGKFGQMNGNASDSEKRPVKNGVMGKATNGYGGLPGEMQSQSSGDYSDRHFFEGGNVAISIQVLREVTDNFNEANVLGRGGFGIVYKGEMPDGTRISVKRMECAEKGTKGMNEFQAEIAMLTKVRHRHLVALLGYCINGNERLLENQTFQSNLGVSLIFQCNCSDRKGSTKVDVYAFRVVLMEIVTGRQALDITLPEEKSHLVTWFRRVLINKENFLKVVDETISCDDETMAMIFKVAKLAGHWTAREPYQRADMGHAVNVLGPLVEQWKPTTQEDDGNSGIELHMSLPHQAFPRSPRDFRLHLAHPMAGNGNAIPVMIFEEVWAIVRDDS
ncbi:hypothetical protein F3Y22_tig00110478pilonHSYRG00171 [Hibiscus syriacus]|uniref:Protein kinase domain-containing protein n=1 Tax=Hibiscus syriacus TaxID=106335 RepID=A0A6A3AFZ6_HIBSY|nr:hypothetical protein F3Y22_tig00110478pilonHSYRG00171 [Hibiscus syriacus]